MTLLTILEEIKKTEWYIECLEEINRRCSDSNKYPEVQLNQQLDFIKLQKIKLACQHKLVNSLKNEFINQRIVCIKWSDCTPVEGDDMQYERPLVELVAEHTFAINTLVK